MAKSRYHRLGIVAALVETMAKGCASKQRLKDSQRLEKSFEIPCRGAVGGRRLCEPGNGLIDGRLGERSEAVRVRVERVEGW
jgi:hypothetical protein